MPADQDAAILARVIDARPSRFDPHVATALLEWDFPETDLKKMRELAEKARQGSLTPEEESLLDSYIRIGHLVNLVQAKARVSLAGAN